MTDIDISPSALPWETWLQPDSHVMCSHMTSEPRALLQSLARADLPPGLSVELGVPFSMDAHAFPETVTLHVMGGMGTAAALGKKRPLHIDRKEYPAFPEDYASGKCNADIVLISLAQAAVGSLHLGASQGAAVDAARRARVVIAEINTAAPVVSGASWPDDIAITHRVTCDYPVATIQTGTGRKDQEAAIAAHLSDVIPDGACLQVGIGAIPEAILSSLRGHRHLGIHTGMLGDALYQLIEAGAVDNSNKPSSLRKTIAGCFYGSESLYQAIENRPDIELAHPSQTHALNILQRIDKFTSINSAIEVDLLGRVNAETVTTSDGRRRAVGGIGGLPAFVRGALRSSGGQSIIALPALTRYDGSGRSRIVRSIETEITVDDTLADIVVTEFGVARLRGASATERRERMLAISSPDVRQELS